MVAPCLSPHLPMSSRASGVRRAGGRRALAAPALAIFGRKGRDQQSAKDAEFEAQQEILRRRRSGKAIDLDAKRRKTEDRLARTRAKEARVVESFRKKTWFWGVQDDDEEEERPAAKPSSGFKLPWQK
mmetsp:Transcript_13603/g.46989  ORF Transcript_13603/g.46989 Transcript_13603/m.46989 type:complete len:128 (+) Transcript_13603:165-548(+)